MMKELIQNYVDGYGFGISKEKLVNRVYFFLRSKGIYAYIINEKYLGADREEFQFIKSRKENRWIVKQF